jgi:hypothetical protein
MGREDGRLRGGDGVMVGNRLRLYAASTILAMMAPSMASGQSTPAFRVPLGSAPTSTNVAATYAWLQQVGSCSSTCGPGTRATTYQCQNVADYDYSGSGYGLPEAASMCTSTIGAAPASASENCTVYSGCGYDWVKPPVLQDPVPLNGNPKGRLGCGYVNQKFSPYCQRSGGSGGTIKMAAGDYRFCSADRPDYDDVASGNSDALGFDRNVVQVGACAPQDHDWIQGGFGSWSSGCDTNATRTQVVSCRRRFDGNTYATPAAEQAACGGTRPASSETAPQYGSCTYSYAYSEWTGWSSGCDTNATRTRTAQCRRSNNGGDNVPDASCTAAGITKAALSETSAQYGSCTYVYKTAEWSAYSSTCSAAAVRTRDVWCERSNKDRVVDSDCTAKGLAKPAGSESSPQYGGCTYSWQQGGFGAWSSSCSNNATRTQTVTCRRDLDGVVVADGNCNAAARPPASQSSGQYGSCGYTAGGTPSAWSSWGSSCSSNTTRSRQYQCVRSNDGGQVVASAECTNRSVNLTETQSGSDYSLCSYAIEDAGVGACNGATKPHYWVCRRQQTGEAVDTNAYCGRSNPTLETCAYTYTLIDGNVGACQTNNQAPHYWSCRRNETGEMVDSATYCGRSNPTYEACQYPFTYTLRDAGVGACNGVNKPHYWSCTRDQTGEGVDSGTYCGRSNPTYESCLDTYSLRDAGLGACQTNNQAPHYWGCVRDRTGEQVDSATYCGRSNPTYESCPYPWTYRLEDAGTGACNGTNRPHYWGCIREQDGARVDSGAYCGRSNPTYETCGFTYTITDGGVGACQTNNQAPHYWGCRRNETGETVDSATYCGRSNPTYDSCPYPWTYTPSYTPYNTCSNGTQSRSINGCTRADGTAMDPSICVSAGHPASSTQSCTSAPPPASICVKGWGPEVNVWSEDSPAGVRAHEISLGACTSGEGGTSPSTKGRIDQCWTRSLGNGTIYGRNCKT